MSYDKNVVNDGRHYKNPFDDYTQETNYEEIDDSKSDVSPVFKILLTTKSREFIEELERNTRNWYIRDDLSIYTGNAGIAQMYYHCGQIFNESSYTKRALELVEKCFTVAKQNKRISYMAGSAGPLALGSVIYFKIGDTARPNKLISKLISIADKALEENSDELLYGKIGYLYALLFVNSNIPSHPVQKELIKQVVGRILTDGREYSKSHNHPSPLMYQWHDKEYIGGAHGLAGILYVLLQASEYLTEAQLQQEVKPSLDYLEKLQFPSGNFPSSVGNNTDKLVHWCHGAPSVAVLFTRAYQIFEKESYLQTAIKCGEVVWSRGLLKKGYSLCHGVSGNAYTFICLYQQTKDVKYLYRACKFAQWCMDYGKHCERTADRPFSLFEGLAGTIYFLADLCQPTLAKFPAYVV